MLTLLEVWTHLRDAKFYTTVCSCGCGISTTHYNEGSGGLCSVLRRLSPPLSIRMEIDRVIQEGVSVSPHKYNDVYIAPKTQEGFEYRREFCQAQIDKLTVNAV